MIRALVASAVVLALTACAGPIEGPVEPAASAPAPGPVGNGAGMRIARSGPAALGFVEEVAAGCLLDGVVGGAAMVVDRPAGRVIIVGDEEELLTIDVVPAGGGSRLDLSGPAVANPQLRRDVVRQIERAARTGDPTCPVLPA